MSNAKTFALQLAFAALPAFAGSFVWTDAKGNGDWADKENYTLNGAKPSALPGASDIVTVPAGAKVYLDYDENVPGKLASCTTFAGVGQVIPDGADTEFDITVAEGQTFTLNCAVSSGHSTHYGLMRKRGQGTLALAAVGTLKSSNSKEYYDYEIGLDIVGGALKLPQGGITGTNCGIYRGVTVREGATLFTVKPGYTEMYGGFNTEANSIVTNDSASVAYLRIRTRSTLGGRIGGSVGIMIHQDAVVDILSKNNTFTGAITLWYNKSNYAGTDGGVLGVMKFGANDSFSSLGANSRVTVRDLGGGVRYLGDGETTDRDFLIWGSGGHYGFIDGGAKGGLVWTGKWGMSKSSSETYSMKRLVIAGSNDVPCVMSGIIEAPDSLGTNYTFRITKKGEGKWTILHNDDSDMRGVFAVEEGTLGFDTLAERGVNSALGKSTILQKDVGNVAVDPQQYAVDYALLLGGGTGGTTGTIEYLGATNSISTTRKIAIDGTGSILNNGTGRIEIAPVSVLAGNLGSTLVLGGSNTQYNAVENLSDGEDGALSVVKEGDGTWRLGTNCTFTGALTVKEGVLVVGNPLYEYYRWVIRSTFSEGGTSSGNLNVGLRAFGLFDRTGADRTFALSHDGYWSNHKVSSSAEIYAYRGKSYSYDSWVFGDPSHSRLMIDYGHFCFTRYDGTNAKSINFGAGNGGDNPTVSNLFAHSSWDAPNVYARYKTNPDERLPRAESENTWYVFTMRPTPGTPIVGWDYVNGYYNASYQMISNCWLEASVTGLPGTWVRIGEVSNGTQPARDTWQSNGSEYVAGYESHATSMPIRPGETNEVVFAASSVSVAPGAELCGVGPEAIPVPKIVIDSDGMGALSGFALSEGGAIEIANPKDLQTYSIAADLTGVVMPARYSIEIPGASAATVARIAPDGKSIEVYRRGFIMCFR